MNVQELVERLKAQELASLEAVELEAQAAEQEVDEEDIPREERVEIASSLDLAFDGRLGSFQTVPLAVGVDASAWTSAVLVLLVHRTDGMADGSELRVSVQSSFNNLKERVSLAIHEAEIVLVIISAIELSNRKRTVSKF